LIHEEKTEQHKAHRQSEDAGEYEADDEAEPRVEFVRCVAVAFQHERASAGRVSAVTRDADSALFLVIGQGFSSMRLLQAVRMLTKRRATKLARQIMPAPLVVLVVLVGLRRVPIALVFRLPLPIHR
jgi:hypothetical protein